MNPKEGDKMANGVAPDETAELGPYSPMTRCVCLSI